MNYMLKKLNAISMQIIINICHNIWLLLLDKKIQYLCIQLNFQKLKTSAGTIAAIAAPDEKLFCHLVKFSKKNHFRY